MNKQTDPNVKTIRFPITADSKLHKMADKCGLTKIEFFIAMVDYFYKSKKDPRDLNDELLKKELVKRTDTIIGFIRTMEEELLRPLKKDGERISKSQEAIVNHFNKYIIAHNKEQKEAYAGQETKLTNVASAIKRMEVVQQSNEILKARFSKILDYYIQAREQMGVMTKQAETDALAYHVRMELQMIR
jgi:hypothetical protein